jgi:DNA polymerase IV
MERIVAHVDLDSFFVSVERLKNSQLAGIPLIIGGSSDRGVVACCSYEARVFGVRSAMPMKLALRLCPHARVLKGDMEQYSNYSHSVTQIIREQAPLVEKASIDEFYLDISGMDKYFGCLKWTTELVEKVTCETGLPISFGLSVNKTVSKIATGEVKPRGRIEVTAPQVKPFLDPLSIKKIPSLGDATFQVLSRLGIRKIATLAGMPVEMLQRLLGQNGISLWKKANGIDDSAVEPYNERKSISTENTFHQDTIDIAKVKTILIGMVEKLAYQLRSEEWLCSVITVKIRYNNFDTHTQQAKIAYTSADHILLKKVTELFDKVYERRMRLRLVGVRFSGLVRGSYQINLFEDTTELVSLYQAIDRMKKRFGFDAIQRCAGVTLK